MTLALLIIALIILAPGLFVHGLHALLVLVVLLIVASAVTARRYP